MRNIGGNLDLWASQSLKGLGEIGTSPKGLIHCLASFLKLLLCRREWRGLGSRRTGTTLEGGQQALCYLGLRQGEGLSLDRVPEARRPDERLLGRWAVFWQAFLLTQPPDAGRG